MAMELQVSFNVERMREALLRMQTHQQLAFGAACCERMLPSYEMFTHEVAWGDARPLRHALDAAWRTCEGRTLPGSELQAMLLRCEKCAPESEDFDSLYTSPAQDATFAVCALVEFMLHGDLSHMVSIPQFSTDTVDLIVQELGNMDPRDPLREQKILLHPLMQQELFRQRRDLSAVINLAEEDGMMLSMIRSRARGESLLAEG